MIILFQLILAVKFSAARRKGVFSWADEKILLINLRTVIGLSRSHDLPFIMSSIFARFHCHLVSTRSSLEINITEC